MSDTDLTTRNTRYSRLWLCKLLGHDWRDESVGDAEWEICRRCWRYRFWRIIRDGIT